MAGVLLSWRSVTSGSDYDQVKIYSSTSETGTYSLVATQRIDTTTYYDADGTTSTWYKLKWYDSSGEVLSDFSDAFQGGTFYGYCEVQQVRDLANITSSMLDDTAVAKLIEFASQSINSDIQIHVEDEHVEYIDNTKQNKIDGSNTTFYTKKYPIGDLDNDFNVTTSDIEAYSVDGDGTKTTLTVSTITPKTGAFTLDSAPNNVEIYLTYKTSQLEIDRDNLHPLVKLACAFKAGALGFSKLNVGKYKNFRLGNMTIFKDNDAHKYLNSQYNETLARINDRRSFGTVDATDYSFV